MFQIGGLSSGLDTTTIIEQLMLLERKPILALESRKTEITRKESALQSLNTRLSSLRSRLSDLKLASNMNAKSATSSQASVLTASAGAGAVEGSYRIKVNQLATATSVSGSLSLAAPASANLKLSELRPAGGTAVTEGTFTVGGTTITIHSTDATLQEIVDALNGTGSANVSVSGSTGLGNTAARLTSEGKIELNVSAKPDVAIGGGADTSNFLTVAGLKSPAIGHVDPDLKDGHLRIGARLNVVQTGSALADANFATPIAGSGTFKINGVEIQYTDSDSLGEIISRINAAGAGVVASYNAVDDRLVLTSKTTGNSAISLEDVSGNFLAATNLLNATQQIGKNASITIEGLNGGNPIESATNEFKNIVDGVIFTAREAKGEWTTVTIAADTQKTIDTVKAFISEFNATVDALASARAKGQPLASDSALSSIYNQLFRMVYDPIEGLTGTYTTLSSIGIGTSKDDRNHLSLDEQKFKAALESNPERVLELFTVKVNDKDVGVADRLSKYLTDLAGESGVFAARKESFASQTKYLTDQIEKYELRIEQRRKTLLNQFTAMEKAVATMKSQQSAMLAQLGALSSAS